MEKIHENMQVLVLSSKCYKHESTKTCMQTLYHYHVMGVKVDKCTWKRACFCAFIENG